MEGDPAKPLDDEDNVVIWQGEVRIPEPRPIDEVTLEFTYEYDESGILFVTLKDVERDRVAQPLDRMPITFGVTKDRRALVELAGRVSETLESHSLAGSSAAAESPVADREASELVNRARTKVIPFLDDSQGKILLELVRAVESAVDGQYEEAKRSLETELRKYSYLF